MFGCAADYQQPSVHSIPSAPDQVAGAAQDDGTLPINQPFPAEAPKLESGPAAMEGIINGHSTDAPASQVPAPPVAQAPSASAFPATASAPIAPPAASLPVSAPSPSPAPTRPSSIPPAVSLPPEKPRQHGAPTRIYLNDAAMYIMEGMKYLAFYRPEKPLKWMGEFLLKRSAEIEG
jgi:COMPASS component SDC1